MGIRWLGACGVSVFLVGCGSQPEIRVVNETGKDVSYLVIEGPEQRETFGPLKVGQATEYRSFSRAYRYSPGRYMAEGVMYEMEIFDYVGEQELGSGKHEYVLTTSGLTIR